MSNFASLSKGINKTDWVLYSVSVVLGISIVLSNYYLNTMETSRSAALLDNYLEKIITRMDAVSGQLSTWGAIDVRQSGGRY